MLGFFIGDNFFYYVSLVSSDQKKHLDITNSCIDHIVGSYLKLLVSTMVQLN